MATVPRRLAPGETIGILGGGQLGRMLAMAAARLGYKAAIFDPDADAPAAAIAARHIRAGYDDERALAEFAGHCAVITYEFENVPVEAANFLAKHRPVFPDAQALLICQDRIAEKTFLNRLDIATALWAPVREARELDAAGAATGFPAILKTARFGYDGKGQAPVMARADLAKAWTAVGQKPAVLEAFVDFSAEISVIAARGGDGEYRAYDPPLNRHSGGILRTSSVPAPVSAAVVRKAAATARRIMDALSYCGVMAVEFFVGEDGVLRVNEMAPRVHNSGHWTEAACVVSQFEQHVRAICGLPLGDPGRHSDCVMENLIGEDVRRIPDLLAEPDCMVHLYGKREVRGGRKMGHFTRLLKSAE